MSKLICHLFVHSLFFLIIIVASNYPKTCFAQGWDPELGVLWHVTEHQAGRWHVSFWLMFWKACHINTNRQNKTKPTTHGFTFPVPSFILTCLHVIVLVRGLKSFTALSVLVVYVLRIYLAPYFSLAFWYHDHCHCTHTSLLPGSHWKGTRWPNSCRKPELSWLVAEKRPELHHFAYHCLGSPSVGISVGIALAYSLAHPRTASIRSCSYSKGIIVGGYNAVFCFCIGQWVSIKN